MQFKCVFFLFMCCTFIHGELAGLAHTVFGDLVFHSIGFLKAQDANSAFQIQRISINYFIILGVVLVLQYFLDH